MGSLGAVLKNPDDLFPLLKLKRAMKHAEKQIPPEPHWGFCYSMLHKVSRSFALVIQQLDANLRNAVRPGNFLSFLCLLWWVFFFFFLVENFDWVTWFWLFCCYCCCCCCLNYVFWWEIWMVLMWFIMWFCDWYFDFCFWVVGNA